MVRALAGFLTAAAGFLTLVASYLWNTANLEDELPCCSVAGCSASALTYYYSVYVESTVLIVASIIALALGVWQMATGQSPPGPEEASG